MKLVAAGITTDMCAIAPARGRGLKQPAAREQPERHPDRPREGARIETSRLAFKLASSAIAPARGRGLKPVAAGQGDDWIEDRPREGARIETG